MKDIDVKYITEEEYLCSQAIVVLENLGRSEKYGFFRLGGKQFKFTWGSEFVNPEVRSISDQIISIGIDLNFLIFDIATHIILLDLKLSFFSLKLIIMEKSYS